MSHVVYDPRTCGYCGYRFVPVRDWQTHCSTRCRRLAWVRYHPRIDLDDDAMPLELRQIIMDWVQLGEYKPRGYQPNKETT